MGSRFEGKLPINELEIKKLVPNPAIVMIAKRGSGKSWIVRALMYAYKDIPVWVIISRTETVNPFYSKFYPDTFIYDKFDSKIIEKILNRQIILKEKKKTHPKLDTRIGLIMDDCLTDAKDWEKSESVREVLFNGRHYDIMYVLTMQFPLGIKPDLRINFDYVFLLADDSATNIKKLHDHYAGIFSKLDAFKDVFFQLTKNYGAMVLIKRDANAKFEDKINYYIAPDLSNEHTRIGSQQIYDFHKNNYNEKWQHKHKGIGNYYKNKMSVSIQRHQ
jgi:hypothetical protein